MDRSHAEAPLRIGYVPLIRPAFKGDANAVVGRSLAGLERLGSSAGFEVVTAAVGSDARQAGDGARVPAAAVTNADEAQRAARAFADADLDLLLVQHATFATGAELAPLLRLGLRTGLWAVPEIGIPHDSDGGAGGPRTSAEAGTPSSSARDVGWGPLPLNSLCGVLMSASLVDAPEVGGADRPVAWFYGHADEPDFAERFDASVAALRGIRALEGATVLQIGGTAPGFYGIRELPTQLASLGVEVVDRPLAALFERIEAAGADAVAAARARMVDGAEVELDDPTLQRAARIEAGLVALADDVGADALAVRCWPEVPERCGAVACAGMGDLAGRGAPAACEGDVLGALSMLALQSVARAPSILMDISDLDATRDALLLWHCGNAPAAWAAGDARPRLTRHFNRDDRGAVRDMDLRPGPATGLRLLEGGAAALELSGTILEPGAGAHRGFDGVRGWLAELRWNAEPIGARDAVASLLQARAPHHVAFAPGDHARAVADLAAWLGARPVERAPRPETNVLRSRR